MLYAFPCNLSGLQGVKQVTGNTDNHFHVSKDKTLISK